MNSLDIGRKAALSLSKVRRVAIAEAKSLLQGEAQRTALPSSWRPTRAFLLAGGLGERLRPLTDEIPKCLAPIDGVPLLAIWLRLCARHGVTQVLLNVSRHVDRVERFLESGDWRVDVQLVPESNPVGTAGTVLANRDFTGGDESFYILYSDNLTDVALDRLAAVHATHDAPLTLGLFQSPRPQSSGIVQLAANGLITAFEEKPRSATGTLANAGIYVARQSLFEHIPRRSTIVDFGSDVLPQLIGRMYGCLIDGYLMDIGTPDALALASRQWAERTAAAFSPFRG